MNHNRKPRKKAWKIVLPILAVVILAIAAFILFLTRGKKVEGVEYDGLVAKYGWQEVANNNTLMSGITISRVEAMGFEQIDALTLNADGTFALIKDMHTTVVTSIMPDPVSVVFTFHGNYTQDGNTVRLGKAQRAEGDVS